jgi:ribokinase
MPSVTVVGSVNLDLVATCARLPVPGETVADADLARHPGGKGGNQALAAQRMGARTSLVASVGTDAGADEALRLLGDAGVDLRACVRRSSSPTGTALILVDAAGQNQIVVAPGANLTLAPEDVDVSTTGIREADAVLCQLEIPLDTVGAAAEAARGLFCLNASPARPLPVEVLERTDLVVVNEVEAQALGDALAACGGLIAVTLGSAGARLQRGGHEVAAATPPPVRAVDTVGAGDAFCAALVVSLLEGRDEADALRRACAAGALATTRPGAQPSLPTSDEVDAVLSHR